MAADEIIFLLLGVCIGFFIGLYVVAVLAYHGRNKH